MTKQEEFEKLTNELSEYYKDVNIIEFTEKGLTEIEKLKRDIDLSLKDKQPIIISVGGEIPNHHHGKEVRDIVYEPDDVHHTFIMDFFEPANSSVFNLIPVFKGTVTKEEYENKNNIIKTKE